MRALVASVLLYPVKVFMIPDGGKTLELNERTRYAGTPRPESHGVPDRRHGGTVATLFDIEWELGSQTLQHGHEQLVETLGGSQLHGLVRRMDVLERGAHGDSVQAVEGKNGCRIK